jgi:hypothetical protein
MKTHNDARLAQLQHQHAARWDIWAVRGQARNWWCIKPAGTQTAVHNEDSPEALDAWIRRVDALTGSGITITFHPGYKNTATATWTSPGSCTPATYGPASTAEVIDHAEDTRARQAGLIQWLNDDPEGTTRHLSDAQIEGFLPHVSDDNARRVLQAIIHQNAGSRREDHLARSQPPTGPLPLTGETGSEQAESAPDAHRRAAPASQATGSQATTPP